MSDGALIGSMPIHGEWLDSYPLDYLALSILRGIGDEHMNWVKKFIKIAVALLMLPVSVILEFIESVAEAIENFAYKTKWKVNNFVDWLLFKW